MDPRVIAVIVVVVIVVIVAFLVFPRASKVAKTPKTFHVDLSDERPCYRVNGVPQDTIYLDRGEAYQFHVDAPGHPLYFTKNAEGGPGAPDNIIGNMDMEKGLAEKNTFKVEVSDKAETGTLHYHSMTAPGMGGKLVIRDPKK